MRTYLAGAIASLILALLASGTVIVAWRSAPRIPEDIQIRHEIVLEVRGRAELDVSGLERHRPFPAEVRISVPVAIPTGFFLDWPEKTTVRVQEEGAK